MDKTSGNQHGQEQESNNNRQSMIEAMIPAGLTGQIRDKARDALMTAVVILGMSRTDILEHIQEIARENGLTPQSARVWLLFSKEMQDRAQALGRQVGDQGSQRTYAEGLGYGRKDTRTLGLGAIFRRELTGLGAGKEGNAADDLRVELNREAGHHGDSIQGRNGAFSYDQIVDGWGGAGDGGRGVDENDRVGVFGLDGREGEASLDMETENEYGADGAQIDFDEHERRPGDSVMTPDDLGEVQLAGGTRRSESGHEIDSRDVFVAGKGRLSGGWSKAVQRREAKLEMAERRVAALERKLGGFPGTDKEFVAFAKANPDLDRNQLRLIRKGLNDKDYLGFRAYAENSYLLNNTGNGRGHGDGRIVTQTRACLLMTSEDIARRFQNTMRAKVRLFSRITDFPKEKVSIEHASRMAKPLSQLAAEYAAAHPDKVEEYEESLKRDKGKGTRNQEPGLER